MIYSRLFAAGYKTTREPRDVWTVPSDGTYVVRDVVLTNVGAASGRVGVLVSSPGGVPSYIVLEPSLAPNAAIHWSGRQVLEAGDAVSIVADSAGVTYRVSGYRLT